MKSSVVLLLARAFAWASSLSMVAGMVAAMAATQAREPTSQPILRVEAGMHTTLVRRIAVDAPRSRLFTCSDDKTVRVWQMPEARLINTLRVPIDQGHEGQLFAVAVSPDGKTVATAGWTGWDWDGTASLYLFDVASGELNHRVSGFKDAFHALTWTRDGEHLVIGLQARGGLHLLRLSDYKVVASDFDYHDKVMEIDERHDGLLAVVALDGMVRLYDRDFNLLGRRTVQGGSKPSGVRFSPDGRSIAVSFFDQPVVTVLQARDLSEAFRPRMDGAKAQAGFNSVAWSSDGRYLYAGGDYRGAGETPLYRWDNGGRGVQMAIALSNNRITDVQQMAEGAMVFATDDPGFGIVGPDGRRNVWRGPQIVDFSASHGSVELSTDGAVVSYPIQHGGPAAQSFSPLVAGDRSVAYLSSRADLYPPLTRKQGLEVAGWKNSFEPTINGKRPLLDEYEMSRTFAIVPDRMAVLLGTEWALRLLDANANEVWSIKLPAVAWAVNVSRSGKVAVAALSDGTLRWYRMSDGREELAYFPHPNGRDWIAWIPDGYYMSSVYGDNFVGWHLNRGRDLTPDFYRAVQFDRILYRPDIVTTAFRAAIQPTATRSLALEPAGADFEISRLRDIAPPRLRLQPLTTTRGPDGRLRLQLQLKGERNRLAMQDLTVFVNNIPVTSSQQRRLSGSDTERIDRKLEVDLFDRDNQIRVESFTGVSMGVAEAYYELPDVAEITPPPGDLYLLAIGVNAFPKLPARAQLAYAAADASGIANTLRQRGVSYFQHVYTRLLTDDADAKPARQAILDALPFLNQARPQDTVVVFLASHGISDPAGNYYFVPRDAEPADIEAVRNASEAKSLLSWTVFFEALRGAAGRRLLIVDTCQARNIEGRFEPYSLMKRSAASLFSLIVASKGDEESQEYAPGHHGLFTYALIDALSPSSDIDNNGLVSVHEIFAAARPIVERLRDKSVGPQTPQLIAPPPLGELPLARTIQR